MLGLIFESILRVLGVRPSDHVKETAAFGEKRKTPRFSADFQSFLTPLRKCNFVNCEKLLLANTELTWLEDITMAVINNGKKSALCSEYFDIYKIISWNFFGFQVVNQTLGLNFTMYLKVKQRFGYQKVIPSYRHSC